MTKNLLEKQNIDPMSTQNRFRISARHGKRSGDGYSLEELKSSRSVVGKDFPNFEMLDAKIASALNKIIQNSQFKKKVSLREQKAQKEDWFLRGRQIALLLSSDWCS